MWRRILSGWAFINSSLLHYTELRDKHSKKAPCSNSDIKLTWENVEVNKFWKYLRLLLNGVFLFSDCHCVENFHWDQSLGSWMAAGHGHDVQGWRVTAKLKSSYFSNFYCLYTFTIIFIHLLLSLYIYYYLYTFTIIFIHLLLSLYI